MEPGLAVSHSIATLVADIIHGRRDRIDTYYQ